MIFPMKHLFQRLSSYLSLAPHLVALLLLAAFSMRLKSNISFLRSVRHHTAQSIKRPPRVSVLVPARNEATTITACVTSLLCQQYPDLEIIVLDDGSTDGTGELLDLLKAQHPALHVIHSTDDPPKGWNGKSYACHRLAEMATGDWLLFTDADTIHTPTSIEQGVVQADTLHAALLSAFPHQRTETWSERIIVSFIVDFIPLITLDFNGIWRGDARRTAANGQYLLARATEYRAVGGHASIASALIDDFALARHFRASGRVVALVDGTSMLTCRMYHSFHEVWDGFSKNVLDALTSTTSTRYALWWAPLFAWSYACIFVIPFFNLLCRNRKPLAAIEIGWLLFLRGLVGWHLKRPLCEILTTPLASWGMIALGLAALYRRTRNQPMAWKERLY